MDLLTILSYVNKISLLIFFVTLGILIYQIYLFKKDLSIHENEEINIPDFDENLQIKIANYTRLPDYLLTSIKKPILNNNQKNIFNVTIAGSLVIFTLIIFFILKNKIDTLVKNQQQNISPTPIKKLNEIAQNNFPTPTENISPTEIVSPTEMLTVSPTETISPTEIIIASPTINEQNINETKSITITITNTPTQIVSLPITATFDKTVFFLIASLSFILLAFAF
ncbi:MAG: hypothetical protein ACPLRN_00255 [Microgenomates group bacterium]